MCPLTLSISLQEELQESQKSISQLAEEVQHAFAKHADDDHSLKAQAASNVELQLELQRTEDRNAALLQQLKQNEAQLQAQTGTITDAEHQLAISKECLEQTSEAKVKLYGCNFKAAD